VGGEVLGGQRHFTELPGNRIEGRSGFENRAKRSTYMQMATVSESSFSKGDEHFYGDPLRSSHSTTEHSTKQTKVSETIPSSSSRLFYEEQTRSSDISHRNGDKNSGILVMDTHVKHSVDLTTDRGVKDSGQLTTNKVDRRRGILTTKRSLENIGVLSTKKVVKNIGILSTERGVRNSGILTTEMGVEDNGILTTERGVLTTKRGIKNNNNLSGTKNKKEEEKENEFVTDTPWLNDNN